MTQSTYAIIGVCGDKSLVLGANGVVKDEKLLLRYARSYKHYRPAFAVRVKRWKRQSSDEINYALADELHVFMGK